jgi:hypothetical protein
MANGTVKWFDQKKDLASLNKMMGPMYSFITQPSMQLGSEARCCIGVCCLEREGAWMFH